VVGEGGRVVVVVVVLGEKIMFPELRFETEGTKGVRWQHEERRGGSRGSRGGIVGYTRSPQGFSVV
jgi:hypothetical protein